MIRGVRLTSACARDRERDWAIPLEQSAEAHCETEGATGKSAQIASGRAWAAFDGGMPQLLGRLHRAVDPAGAGARRSAGRTPKDREADRSTGVANPPHPHYEKWPSSDDPADTRRTGATFGFGPRHHRKAHSDFCICAKQAWRRLQRRAHISDLHFRDPRHEAITRLFELGLSLPEVALISGHRDPRMLFRYTHLRAEDVAKKLTLRTPSWLASPTVHPPPASISRCYRGNSAMGVAQVARESLTVLADTESPGSPITRT